MPIKLIAILFLFGVFNSYGQDKVRVAFGDALAPWVIPDTNSGITVDIITEALTPLGYEVVPYYYPYSRRVNSYKFDLVDVVSDMNMHTMRAEELVGYFTGPVYEYQNYLISLSENKFDFASLADVGDRSLISWQGALDHLGKEYKDLMSKHPNYKETHDQSLQVKMLFLKRYEVAQMDLQIFNYYRHQISLSKEVDTSVKVDMFPVLGASPNGFLFKDKKLMDIFTKRIAELKLSGEYQKIIQRYIGDYQSDCRLAC